MRLRLDRDSPSPIHQQLREQIQSALHVGQLQPGDRLPSLREMARRNGVNPKTVLRAYRALQSHGLIEIRPGSGAIVGGETVERAEEKRALEILKLARRHRAEAQASGLSAPEHRMLLERLEAEGQHGSAEARSRLRIVFLECNGEQATISAREITRRLGVSAFPVVLPAASESAEAILRMADLWVTTDFHHAEVRSRALEQQRPCLTVRLDPRFSRAILAAARNGHVAMVHPDPSIVPAFAEILASTGVPAETLERIRGVAGTDPEKVRREIAGADAIYVSPLCSDEIRRVVPRGAIIPVPRWTIAASSIEALRATILTLPIMAREQSASGARPVSLPRASGGGPDRAPQGRLPRPVRRRR